MGGGGCPMGFSGLLITGILMSWHQGNVIPHCLCNPEKLRSSQSVRKLRAVSQSIRRTKKSIVHNGTMKLSLLLH